MGSDTVMYEVPGIVFVVACILVCGLFSFVELDGCEHDEYHYTTASSDPGFAK